MWEGSDDGSEEEAKANVKESEGVRLSRIPAEQMLFE
jgi:hypothetical protein